MATSKKVKKSILGMKQCTRLNLFHLLIATTLLISSSIQHTYFLQLPEGLRNKLVDKEEKLWHPRLEVWRISHGKDQEMLNLGYKYSHFKHLVESRQLVAPNSNGQLSNSVLLGKQIKNLNCACSFSKLFVKTVGHKAAMKLKLSKEVMPQGEDIDESIETDLSDQQLHKVKHLLRKRIKKTLRHAKNKKEAKEQIKKMEELMRDNQELKKMLKEAKKREEAMAEAEKKVLTGQMPNGMMSAAQVPYRTMGVYSNAPNPQSSGQAANMQASPNQGMVLAQQQPVASPSLNNNIMLAQKQGPSQIGENKIMLAATGSNAAAHSQVQTNSGSKMMLVKSPGPVQGMQPNTVMMAQTQNPGTMMMAPNQNGGRVMLAQQAPTSNYNNNQQMMVLAQQPQQQPQTLMYYSNLAQVPGQGQYMQVVNPQQLVLAPAQMMG